MAKKKFNLMKNAGNTVKLGVGSMAGMGVLGAMGSASGMPKQAGNIAGIAGAGLAFANVGQFAKTGMGVAGMLGKSGVRKRKSVKGKSSHHLIHSGLGKMLSHKKR